MSNISKNKTMENKETTKKEYSIPNTLGIIGVEGSGRTTILKKCVSKIRAEKDVRVISIASDSYLVWKNKEVKKVKIHKHFGYSKDDEASSVLKIKDAPWQNIVFEDHFAQCHQKATEVLSQKIIEFAEKSNIPCVFIVEEICGYRKDQAEHLMQVFDALSKVGGYFLFTMNARYLPSDAVDPFLDKVDTIVDLGMRQAPHKGEISFKRSVKMEVFRTSKGTIEYGYKINPNPGFANFIDGKDLYDRTKANHFYI